jgi:hypothetical protein
MKSGFNAGIVTTCGKSRDFRLRRKNSLCAVKASMKNGSWSAQFVNLDSL